MAGPIKNVRIGEVLLESGFISQKQLDDALQKQKGSGKMLGDIVLEMGLVSETQLAQALSIRLKVPFVDLSSVKVSTEAVGKIPENVAKEKMVFAYAINHNRLLVATNDPVNFYIFEDLKVTTGMEIVPQISTRSQIEAAINKFYSSQAIDSTVNELESEATDEKTMEQNLAQAESEGRIDNAPIVKLVNMMVETAFRMQVTDIHIEAFKDRTRIRFRIDGELVEQDMKIPLVPQFDNHAYQNSGRHEHRRKTYTARRALRYAHRRRKP